MFGALIYKNGMPGEVKRVHNWDITQVNDSSIYSASTTMAEW